MMNQAESSLRAAPGSKPGGKQSSDRRAAALDCFVATLLAKTSPTGRSLRKRLHGGNRDSGSGRDGGEAFYVSRFRPDIARTGQTDLARRRDRGAPEADGDGVAIRPIGDLAGFDHGAGVGLALHRHRNCEVDLLSPARHVGGDRETVPNRVRGRSLQKLRLERDGSELELDFAHVPSPVSRSSSFWRRTGETQSLCPPDARAHAIVNETSCPFVSFVVNRFDHKGHEEARRSTKTRMTFTGIAFEGDPNSQWTWRASLAACRKIPLFGHKSQLAFCSAPLAGDR